MRLTAIDVKKREFQQKMRGFDPEEVQSFLEKVADEVEQLTRERITAEEKARDVQKRLDHFLSLEQTLERTLVAAQQTALNIEEQARKEAELILGRAEVERERSLARIAVDTERAKAELFQLRAEYDSTLLRMKSLMSGFGQFLDSVTREVDFTPAVPSTGGAIAAGPVATPEIQSEDTASISVANSYPTGEATTGANDFSL